MTSQELQDQLEALIDSATLNSVLNALQNVCAGKAEHVDSCYNACGLPDKALSKRWMQASKAIEKVEDKFIDL